MTAFRTSPAVFETIYESGCTWTETLQCVNHFRDSLSVERCKHITQNVTVDARKPARLLRGVNLLLTTALSAIF